MLGMDENHSWKSILPILMLIVVVVYICLYLNRITVMKGVTGLDALLASVLTLWAGIPMAKHLASPEGDLRKGFTLLVLVGAVDGQIFHYISLPTIIFVIAVFLTLILPYKWEYMEKE